MPTTSSRRSGDKRLLRSDIAKDVSLQVMVPARIKREVRVEAAKKGVTQRALILSALRAIGFVVKDNDLDDRRKAR